MNIQGLLDAFKDSSGHYNMAEVGAAHAFVALLGFTGYDVFWLGHAFSAISFAGACSTIIGALGAAQYMRGDSAIDLRREDANRENPS